MIVIAFSVITVVLGTSISMADWSLVGTTSGTEEDEVYTLGNVGIGTDDPVTSLQIHNTGTTYLHLTNSASGSELTDGTELSANSDYGANLWNWENGYLRFGTNNNERMRITSQGKVGIGISTPVTTLQIHSTNTTYLHLTNSTSGTELTDGAELSANSDYGANLWNWENGYLRFGTNNNERMRTTSQGNVGIGTSSPSCKLDVAGITTSSNYSCTSSDIRYKKNITPIENALNSILALRGVNYFWKTDQYKDKNFMKEKQVGFIA